jgi:ribosomal protein L40E
MQKNFVDDNVNVKVCPKCGFENTMNVTKCQMCFADLKNEVSSDIPLFKQGYKPRTKRSHKNDFWFIRIVGVLLIIYAILDLFIPLLKTDSVAYKIFMTIILVSNGFVMITYDSSN